MPAKKDSDQPPVYRFRVSNDVEGATASFIAGDEAVELSPESPVYETENPKIAAGLRGLWFLAEAD